MMIYTSMMTNNNVPDTTGWEISQNLDTTDFAFTMSQLHDIVPEISGIAAIQH